MTAGTVALLEELPEDQLDVLRTALPDGWRVSAAADDEALGQAEHLVVRDGRADADVLERASRLRSVVRIDLGEGFVDEEACRRRSIPVELVPSPALLSVAEHTVAVILAIVKRIPQAGERLRAGERAGGVEPEVTTQESYAYNWVGLERFEALFGLTVGLVGLGKIGTHAARLLRPFGVDLVYTKRNRLARDEEAALGVRYLPFERLLQESHCVSLHNRFTPETERMMGEREFAAMQAGSFFVNTARGRLVDEDALVRALESGHLAGAALDVFWMEPLPSESPLLSAPNILLTPHTGGIPIAESRKAELRDAGRRLAAAAERAAR
jgi:phosphoglycerate dehydrogenase-like enzyme